MEEMGGADDRPAAIFFIFFWCFLSNFGLIYP